MQLEDVMVAVCKQSLLLLLYCVGIKSPICIRSTYEVRHFASIAYCVNRRPLVQFALIRFRLSVFSNDPWVTGVWHRHTFYTKTFRIGLPRQCTDFRSSTVFFFVPGAYNCMLYSFQSSTTAIMASQVHITIHRQPRRYLPLLSLSILHPFLFPFPPYLIPFQSRSARLRCEGALYSSPVRWLRASDPSNIDFGACWWTNLFVVYY